MEKSERKIKHSSSSSSSKQAKDIKNQARRSKKKENNNNTSSSKLSRFFITETNTETTTTTEKDTNNNKTDKKRKRSVVNTNVSEDIKESSKKPERHHKIKKRRTQTKEGEEKVKKSPEPLVTRDNIKDILTTYSKKKKSAHQHDHHSHPMKRQATKTLLKAKSKKNTVKGVEKEKDEEKDDSLSSSSSLVSIDDDDDHDDSESDSKDQKSVSCDHEGHHHHIIGDEAEEYDSDIEKPRRLTLSDYDDPIVRQTIIVDDDDTSTRKNKRFNLKASTAATKMDTDGDEGREGSYVRITPVGLESKLVRLAKQGHSQTLQSAAVHDLMRVQRDIYCDDITQDALENKNYVDPSKTNTSYLPEDKRKNFVNNVMKSWIEEDFMRAYQNTETMTLLEQYEAVEDTLEKDNERKKISVKTTLEDLPIINAAYNMEFLREPIVDLGERRCIAGDDCVSFYMFNHMKANVPFIPTPPTPTLNTTTQQQQQDSHQSGFIIREFLLPAQKTQLELDVSLGVPIKEALEKIERKHCLLCNRYLTTVRAARISAGIRDIPTNTIQDHRNYFNCVGEYPLKSMIYFSADFCGIIGEMVGFNNADYATATIEYKYNTTTQEERSRGIMYPDKVVTLRSWVEKNLVSGSKKHEEGK